MQHLGEQQRGIEICHDALGEWGEVLENLEEVNERRVEGTLLKGPPLSFMTDDRQTSADALSSVSASHGVSELK